MISSSLTIPLKFTLSEISTSKNLPDFVPSGISNVIFVSRLRSVSVVSILSVFAVGLTILVFSPFLAPPIVISTFVMASSSVSSVLRLLDLLLWIFLIPLHQH